MLKTVATLGGGGGGGNGTVTSVSVTTAHGFAGTVTDATTTPAISLTTTVTGILKGDGANVSAATSGVDYAPATVGSAILYGNGSGGFSNVTIGTNLTFVGGTLSASGGGGMTYPGVGIANSTGSAWGTSYSTSGSGNVALTTSPSFTTPILGTPTSGNLSNCTNVPVANAAGTLAIANGGSNQTAFTSPASGIAGLVWFDGTSFQNDTTTSHVGYNSSTNTFYANNPNFSGTTVIGTLSGLLKGTSGTISAATSGTDYAPATSGSSILYGNGAGGFSSVTIGTNLSFSGGVLNTASSVVSSVTGTAPISSSGGTTPAISISQASGSTNGYLSSTDWTTFNSKVSMVYPGAGIPNSTGTAWGTSYSTSGSGNVALTTSPSFTTPVLGTPTSGNLSGCTSIPVANASGTLAVVNGGTGVTTSTGSGNVVLSTSPTFTTPILGTPTSGNLTNCTADGTNSVGFLNIPQNAQTGNYTLVLGDSGKHIYHKLGDAAATYTIPAASSVAYPLGTAVTFVNLSGNAVTISITTDTLYLGSTGSTGSRTLAQYGVATAVKVSGVSSSGIWVISGAGIT